MKALFDTNILIDYLNGEMQAKHEIERYEFVAISIVTYIEVLVGIRDSTLVDPVKQFLGRFVVFSLDATIAERTVHMRQQLKLKVPDAVILATALQEACILVTRNTKDFSSSHPQ